MGIANDDISSFDGFCERCQITWNRQNYGYCPVCVMDRANEIVTEENQRLPAQADRIASLEAALARITAERDAAIADARRFAEDALALRVRLERAVEALRPFAEFPDRPGAPDNEILTPFAWSGDETFAPMTAEEATLTVGDLRCATAAVKENE